MIVNLGIVLDTKKLFLSLSALLCAFSLLVVRNSVKLYQQHFFIRKSIRLHLCSLK